MRIFNVRSYVRKPAHAPISNCLLTTCILWGRVYVKRSGPDWPIHVFPILRESTFQTTSAKTRNVQAAMDDTLSMTAYKGALAKLEQFMLANPGTDLTRADEDSRTPLHWACAGGNAPVVHFLLEQEGVKAKCLNKADESGLTPFLSAVAGGHMDLMPLLIEHGAKVNARSEQGATALHMHKGRAALIEALLPHVKDINAIDELGVTPLHRAAGPGYYDACRLLLAAGARVNAQDAAGATPLHYAAEEGRPEVVTLLLENGARVDVRDNEGHRAMDVVPKGDAGLRVIAALRAAGTTS